MDFGDYTFFDPCLRDLIRLNFLVVESGVVLTAFLGGPSPGRDRDKLRDGEPGCTSLLGEEEDRAEDMHGDEDSDDDLFFFLSREEEDE